MIKKIISGGQTGADRAALDVALKFDIPHGGWIPKGRKAEDGTLSEIYKLKEMPTDSYPKRTEQNVIDSDGTLIVARGKLTGGSDYTRQMTLKHKKQLLGIDLNLTSHFDAASLIVSWIRMQRVEVLNVAGPRASKDRQIYSDVVIILEQVVKILANEDKKHKVELEHFKKDKISTPPKTVQEAVDRLIDELPLKDKTTVVNIPEDDLVTLQTNLGHYIGNQFGIWSGNRELIESCEIISGDVDLHPDFAPSVIIKELWKCLQETYKLRVVK
ncbi:putative molybdenum carrier protein [bacterium]|nr:putative molybdenum carrier protein [bacterium]